MATHSSILAWRIPWMEELGGLQSMVLQRVGHPYWIRMGPSPIRMKCPYKEEGGLGSGHTGRMAEAQVRPMQLQPRNAEACQQPQEAKKSLSVPLRGLFPSLLHFRLFPFCFLPIPVPSLSLHLSISPPSTRPRFGSGCVTFTRPFSAAVSTETSSGAGEGGDRKQTHPFPCSTGPSASRPATSPSTGISHFLSWRLGSYVFSRNTGSGAQTTEGGLRAVHTCTRLQSQQITLAQAHTCHRPG